MTTKPTNTTVEILGKYYSIRCPESELKPLQQAAEYVSKRMKEVQDSGKAINLERIAIITALNIAFELQQVDHQKQGFVSKLNERILQLQERIEDAINNTSPTELVYSAE